MISQYDEYMFNLFSKNKRQTKYVAIDLELTGFDPEKDKIIEIGLVVFTVSKRKFTIKQQYTKTFFAPKVNSRVQGLTGITSSEIEKSLDISHYFAEIQQFLQDAVLVGHGLTLDIRFLESNGFRLSGKHIDTFDVSQMFLPTHHSYNLENLMHTLVERHQSSHRALPDALASLKVLELLVTKTYLEFPEDLRSFIVSFSKKHLINHELLELLSSLHVDTKSTVVSHETKHLPSSYVQTATRSITSFSTKEGLLNEWRSNNGYAYFPNEDSFDPKRFQSLILSDVLEGDEVKSVIKTKVWLNTNWQQTCLLDMNFTGFASGFRNKINVTTRSTRRFDPNVFERILCHHKDLPYLSDLINKNSSYTLTVFGIHQFEQSLIQYNRLSVSWNWIINHLKYIYNPEKDLGNFNLKLHIEKSISAIDLFFALFQLITKNIYFPSESVLWAELQGHTVEYGKLRIASSNLCDILSTENVSIQSEEVTNFIGAISELFSSIETDAYITTAEIDDGFCKIIRQPLDLSVISQQVLSKFTKVSITDSFLTEDVRRYYAWRFDSNILDFETSKPLASPHIVSSETLMTSVKNNTDNLLPISIISDTSETLRSSFNQLSKEYSGKYYLYAEKLTGGLQKVTKNFGISENSFLLLRAQTSADGSYSSVTPKCLILENPDRYLQVSLYDRELARVYASKFSGTNDVFLLLCLRKAIIRQCSGSLRFVIIISENDNAKPQVLSCLENLFEITRVLI